MAMNISREISNEIEESPFLNVGHLSSEAMKGITRKYFRKILRSLTSSTIERESEAVAEKLTNLSQYKDARAISCFLSKTKGNEINTNPFLKKCFEDKKKVYLPKIMEEGVMMMLETYSMDDIKNNFEQSPLFKTIREPPLEDPDDRRKFRNRALKDLDVDMMVVGGLSFNQNRQRLGYGVGHYDRFIEKYERKINEFNLKNRQKPRKHLPYIVGIALNAQVFENHAKDVDFPIEKHDFVMDCVVTADSIF